MSNIERDADRICFCNAEAGKPGACEECANELLDRALEREATVRQELKGAVKALEQIALRATNVGVGTPCYPLARALGQIAVDALDHAGGQ